MIVTDTLGRGVPGAEVRLLQDGAAAEVRSAAEGAPAEFDVPADRRYTLVVADAPGFGLFVRNLGALGPWSEPAPDLGIVLLPAHTLRGRVLGPGGGPVPGVVVEDRSTDVQSLFDGVKETVRRHATTAADGRFALAGLAEGEANLIVTVAGGGWFLGPTVSVPDVAEIDMRIEEVATLEGAVVAAEDGRALAGAAVTVRTATGIHFVATARTDAHGVFRFPAVARSDLDVSVTAPGRRDGVVRVDRPAGETFPPVRVPLSGFVGATVRGRVTCGGGPVAGAEVAVDPESARAVRTRTAADGTFEIRDLSAGPAVVDVTAFGYECVRAENDPFARPKVELVEGVTVEQSFEMRALPVVAVRGRVEGPGGPVAGARVAVSRAPAESVAITDADGRFEVSGPVDGSLDLELTAPGLDREFEWIRPGEDGVWPAEVVVRMEPEFRAVIRGTVRVTDGTPLRNARVSLVSEDQFGDWDDDYPVAADGTFEIRTAYRGDFHVAARDSGHGIAVSETFELGPGGTPDEVHVALRPAHTLRGRVLRAGVPVASARILRRGSELVLATTGADGEFAIPCVRPADESSGEGPLVVRVGGLDDTPLHRGAGDGEGRVVLDVAPARTLDVSVSDAAGAPIAGARVRAEPRHPRPVLEPMRAPAGTFGSTIAIGIGGRGPDDGAPVTGADGRVRLDGVPPVPLEVMVTPPPGSAGLRAWSVAFVDASAASVAVVVPPGATLRGRVVDADRRPVAGARVQCSGDERPEPVTTGPDGSFAFAGLGEAPRRIVVAAPFGASLRDAREEGVVAGSGEVVVNLGRKLVISGRVRDTDYRTVVCVAVSAVRAGHLFPWNDPPRVRPSRDGQFEIEVEEPGEYRLVCAPYEGESTIHGFLDADRVVAGTQGAQFDCVPIPEVAGCVVGPDGAPLADATVAVFVHDDPDRSVVSAATDEAGAFRVNPRRHGDVTVVVSAPGYAAEAVRNPEYRTSVRVRLAEPELTATGVVDDREGPARHVRLVLESVSRPDVVVGCTTDANGGFVARSLFAGQWRVRAASRSPWAALGPLRRLECHAALTDLGTVAAGARGVRLR